MNMLCYETGSLICITGTNSECRFGFGSCLFEWFFELVCLKRVQHREMRWESFMSLGKRFL